MTYRCEDEWHLGDPATMTTKAGKPRMTNRHPATCCVCGVHLAVGQGVANGKNKDTGRWEFMCPAVEIRLRPLR